MSTIEETVEALVDLLCGDVLPRYGIEDIRQRAQALLVRDHGRRLELAGLHPETGETPGQYEDAIVRHGGKHPHTGETLTEYRAKSVAEKEGT